MSDKAKKLKEDIEAIRKAYVIEAIQNESTPKAKTKIKNIKEFIDANKDMLSSIGIFLKEPDHRNLVGLAANQVSCNGKRLDYRFFMIKQQLGVDSGFDIIINPEIIEKRGTPVTKHEGCLTWPDKTVVATRQPFIVVKYHDITGVMHEGMAITGFEAQIWQHEIDHLNGIEEKIIDDKITGYVDRSAKTGRNDICSCGSGKKYKKCCQLYDNYW